MARRSRVLVVEDEPGMRSSLRRLLEREYDVAEAESCDAARTQGREPYDVAIVDLVLPDGDGFSLLAEIRERPERPVVIVITGDTYDADEKLARALKEKAFYFLTKPFDAVALEALLERGLEVRRLQRDLRRRSEELERDMRLARDFQTGLMPRRPLEKDGLTVQSWFEPCDELAGDLFNYRVYDGDVHLLVADVVGHGISAAMLTGIIASTWSRALRDGCTVTEVHDRMRDLVHDWEEDRFFTAFLGRIDLEKGTLRYLNAGHPPALLATTDGAARELRAQAPMVSPVLADIEGTASTVEFPPGARLLVWTDGLHETRDPHGAYFGTETPRRLLASAAPPATTLDELATALRKHQAGRPGDDDVTVLLAARADA